MNRDEIKEILPHRDPMLLLDTAEKLSDTKARGTYRVRGSEFFLQGHFPGHPIVPGVIECEILAQSACVLLADKSHSVLPLYAGLDKVRFRHPVYPGDRMEMETTVTRRIGNMVRIRGTVTVNEILCMEGILTIALADAGKKESGQGEPAGLAGKADADVS